MEELAGPLAPVAHGRDGPAAADLARDAVDVGEPRQPLLTTIRAHVLAGTPVTAASASGEGSMDGRASQTASSTSGGVDPASLRGLLGRSDSGSPRRARESHFEAVWRLTPIWRATADTRSPPATREASSSRPRA